MQDIFGHTIIKKTSAIRHVVNDLLLEGHEFCLSAGRYVLHSYVDGVGECCGGTTVVIRENYDGEVFILPLLQFEVSTMDGHLFFTQNEELDYPVLYNGFPIKQIEVHPPR